MLSNNAHRLTSGSIARNLFRFALPFLGANFLISLYGAADVFIVSYFANAATLAATATGAQAIFTMMACAMGLALGGTILIGQYFGAKKNRDVLEAIGTVFIMFGSAAIACSTVMVALAAPIATWMETPPEAWNGAYCYILVCGGGMIFSFAYEAISAVLRGLGDSKNPLKFVAVACCINVLLDLLFVGRFGWGAGGAAAATVIAQGFSAFVAVLYLKKQNFIFDFKLRSFRFVPQKAKMILKLGIPTAVQQSVVFMSFTIMTVAVNKLGVIESAVLGITNRIDGFLIMPALAFGSAISVMAAQNMGAGETKRAKKSFYVGLLMSLVFAVPSFFLMLMCPEKLMMMVSTDEVIIRAGGEFMLAYSPDCLLMALVFCMNGFLNGCGRTTFTMINNIASSVVFRIPLILISKTLFMVGLAMPFSTLPQLFISVFYFFKGYWKKSLIGTKLK